MHKGNENKNIPPIAENMLLCSMGNRMLIIGLVWPEPTSSAAGWRMLELIECFLQEGMEVHFASAASLSEFSHPLADIGVTQHQILLNDSSFDTWISALQPDMVLFDRFMVEEQYGWRVAEQCPNAIRILDTEDLHFVRHARQSAYKKKVKFEPDQLYSDMAKRELAAIYRSDCSLIISQAEMGILLQQFNVPPSILAYLPFRMVRKGNTSVQPVFGDRQHFMFIGNFIHEPNWKTVQVLKEIWPDIRKVLPAAELHIYGAYPTEKVWQLDNAKQGFRIKGRAVDAVETMKDYRVLLAPIPFGAGLKGKFIDALHAQTPSVCTAVAAEGLTGGIHWPGFIADDLTDFIEKAQLLYSDEECWNNAVKYGKEMLKSDPDPDWGKNLMARITAIRADLNQHRNHNFIGQILNSNQFQATKYMSQWIELKNKKAHM